MACCDETVEEARSEKWAFVGHGRGAYETVSDMVYVGEGKGSMNKEKAVTSSSFRPACAIMFCLLLVLLLGFAVIYWVEQTQPGADDLIPEKAAAQQKQEIIIKHHYITQERNKVVGVPVPMAGHVVYHKVYAAHKSYDCFKGKEEYRLWSTKHQAWCCWQESIACPTKVVTKDKAIPVTKTVAVKVPHYYHVPVAGPTPKPLIVHVKVPSDPLPPKIVKEPVPVYGDRPPDRIHYKYVPEAKEVKVPKIVYDKKVVEVPVKVKKYVPKKVEGTPEVIYKTRTVYDHPHTYQCSGEHGDYAVWSAAHREYCCYKFGKACPKDHEEDHTHVVKRIKYIDVPVPSPPKVIIRHHQIVKVTHHHERVFDCSAGFSNWYFGWSKTKKSWCCAHEKKACPGTWHGGKYIFHAEAHGEGHSEAHAKIYDCDAGYSNWLQGWSDSKKSWCCHHDDQHRGCVKYHCFHGHPHEWSSGKSDWCCKTFQRGCPLTTLSPLGCDAPCTYKDETSTCMHRIKWTKEHMFDGRDNACALAYSQIQVECDVCRACTIQDAGCEVNVHTSKPYDCNAALKNFFRAWSPPKKHWCCSVEGKGCEGTQPPAVSAGYGMVWKHVQINGYWTWIAVAVGGGGAMSLPYDCHVGLTNWHVGWSAPKKTWCCAHQHMGCEGGGGGGGGGGGSSWQTHTVVTHTFHHHYVNGDGGSGPPPGAAGHGMVWHWQNDGGQWHWVQVHGQGSAKYDCHAGLANAKLGWSDGKKGWCCHFKGLGCA